MISTQDFLNVSLGLGFLVLIGFLSFALYQVAITFKEVRKTVVEFDLMKENLKFGILTFVQNILKRR